MSSYDSTRKEVRLPPDMTIGIEIETVGINGEEIKKIGYLEGWECKNENTIRGKRNETGVEVVSPKLTGEDQEIASSIIRVLNKLKGYGQYANETCAGHIHIGSNYLKSARAYKNLLEVWGNTEKLLYIISNEEGTIPRYKIRNFAIPITGDLKKKHIEINDEDDIETVKEKLVDFQGREDIRSRDKSINFWNLSETLCKKLNKDTIQTIEFRLANGSVNPHVWIENINLFGGIVKAAQDIAVTQSRNPNERTHEEIQMLRQFETLRDTDNLTNEERLEILLSLTIPEEDRNIYIRRYQVNSKLLMENPDLESFLDENITEGNTKLTKSSVGRACFFEAQPIIGTEYSEAANIIGTELEQNNEERN